jgi:hypothetical protein
MDREELNNLLETVPQGGPLRERTRSAAKVLDVLWPGWWANVDVERLDMADACDCVLGQNAPPPEGPDDRLIPYTRMARKLGLLDIPSSGPRLCLSRPHDWEQQPEYRETIPGSMRDKYPSWGDALSAYWREEIAARRSGGVAPAVPTSV